MKAINLGVIALSISALTACGGGSGDTGSSSQPQQPSSPLEVSIEASVMKSKALVDIESQTVVQVDSDIDFRLTAVNLVSNGTACEVTSVEGMTFTTLSDQVGECQFEYTVEPVDQEAYIGQASSFARVSVSETADDNTLPNLSATTDVEASIIIDLAEELSSDLDTSTYTVSEEVTLLGTGSAQVDSVSNTITYSPADIGVTRIMYSMSDGSSVKLGNIDVAVSDTGNTPPIANDYIREGKLAKDMSVEIDLTDYVSDAEDSVILDSVRAYNAETEITSTTEHTFTFQSSEAGPHEVAYTVTDGRGGYAVGQVYIEVEADFSLIQDWQDIVTYDPMIDSEIRFFAPMTQVYADYVNASYTGTYTEDGTQGLKNSKIVTQTLSQARQYCKTRGGRLPLQRELETLVTNETSAFTSHNWPTSIKYWTAENVSETNAATVNLNDGIIGNQSKTVGMYTTCVDMSNPSVKDFSAVLQLTSTFGNEYIYQIEVMNPDGGAGTFQDIVLEVSNDYGVFASGESSDQLIVGENGTAEVSYFDTTFHIAVIAIEFSSRTEFYTFVPDEDASALETTEPAKWNHVDIRYGLPLPEIGINGIPVLFSYSSPEGMGSSTVYKDSFNGADFIMSFQIKNQGNLGHGAASFFVQQQGSLPNMSWYDVTRQQPGAPLTNDTFNIVTQFFTNEFNFYQGYNNYIGSGTADVRHADRYLWFQKKGNQLYHYSSSTEVRPAEPDFVIPFDWGDIDPTKPYWVGVGGSTNYNDVEAYIVNAHFAAYL
ncbi:Ig-like domain-containing protein [Vibrio aestuarianus]|uniref:Ig-like domain-containing protein n=1 Tax=Vibrio aestuarianus TaxID=28171 RepID=UPI0020B151FD|nr:hypothetical protein [Vibrio aestuarianus]